ncbi:histidinol dehydrogenase, partial [Staphylococcus aureus]|nr:histidinol dehydrogenase [Staphylococcus aureus]
IKFDKWDPEQFKLSQAQIEEIVDSIPEDVKHDIAFAQDNIKKFAEAQRDSMKDIHVEVMPGVFLGHKNIPVESVGCYIPGGRYPMIASAHMSILT